MWKRVISIACILCLVCAVLPFAASAEVISGQIGEELSWTYTVGDGLRITGTGNAIPDYAPGEAPWQSVAKNVFQLSLPASLKTIGAYAFFGCANLKSVELPARLESMGKGAFAESGLESIRLPYTLKAVPEEGFYHCEELVSIEFEAVSSGGMGVEIHEGCESIGTAAFAFCTALERLNLPKTLKNIGVQAFSDCYALKTVNVADSLKALTEIGEEAFCDCSALYSLGALLENIREIKTATFRGTALKSIKLPANIQSVGERAFAFCTALNKIDVYNNACVFFNNALTTPNQAVLYVEGAAQNALAYAQAFSKPYKVLCVSRSTSHPTYKTTLTKASSKSNGQLKKVCPSCGHTIIERYAKIKSITLTKTSFTYNAKKQYPSAAQVEVLDADGKVIDASNYTVKAATASKAVGKHYVTIQFKNHYEGSFKRGFYIVPKGTKITAVSAAKTSFKVSWNKQTTQSTGYQIRICKNAKFTSGVKMYTIKNNRTVSYTIKNLPRKTGYYIQMRTFKTVGGKNYCSAWSASFPRKTK